jgi:hypothetical protein
MPTTHPYLSCECVELLAPHSLYAFMLVALKYLKMSLQENLEYVFIHILDI